MTRDRVVVFCWWFFALMLPVVSAIICAAVWPDGVAWKLLALVAGATAVFDAVVGPFDY